MEGNETVDIAINAFALSQILRAKWVTADDAAKRRILDVVCWNCTLDDASLFVTMREPFDPLAEGLVSKESRGDKTRFELFRRWLVELQTDHIDVSPIGHFFLEKYRDNGDRSQRLHLTG